MNIVIYPYRRGSNSAKLLSQKLSELLRRKVLRVQRATRRNTVVINWGNDDAAPLVSQLVYNHPIQVVLARNKLETFRRFSAENVPCVPWTVEARVARAWAVDGPVYARHSLTGQGGSGIELIPKGGAIPSAPLYTKYVSAKHEYRVHVVAGRVIDYAKKKKRNGAEGNKYIRNHDNGYVYARHDVALPVECTSAAIRAVGAVNLTFGAVDILYKETDHTAHVLEINTAPGLDNHTASRYAAALFDLIKQS